MTDKGFLQARNDLVRELSLYLGVPVIMSDQAAPEQPPPYVIYTVTAMNIPINNRGGHSQQTISDAIVTDTRIDTMHATLSITCCSANRWSDAQPPVFILGDDEAFALAERAMAWLEHVGRPTIERINIVVADVMNAANRSGIVVDTAERRYGFDVRIRYARIASRQDDAIQNILFIN